MSRWTALLGLSVLALLVGVGRPAIQDADEGFYAESGREMIVSGDWITPHFDHEPRINKPILFYWLVALDYKIGGIGETGARLWAALAGVGLALATAGIARRWLGPGPDLLAGGIVATSLGLTRLARSALPDVPLACFVTLCIWATFEAVRTDRPRAHARAWLLVAAVAAGLGFLTKGPVAWILVAIVLAPTLSWERWRREPGSPTSSLVWTDAGWAAALVIVVAAPWFVLATLANGAQFLRTFFIGENVDRFMTERFNGTQPVWYYLPIIAGGLLPWSPFLFLLVRPVVAAFRARRASPTAVRLTVWAVAPVLFFTLSVGKQPRYIAPCLVPIALLIAREVQSRLAMRRERTLTIVGILTGLTIVAIGGLGDRLAPMLRVSDPGWTPTGPICLVVAGLAAVAASVILRNTARAVAWVAAAAVAAVSVEATVYWPTRPEPVERIAARIAAEAPTLPVCSCRAFARNLGYYAHVTNVIRDSDDAIQAFLETPPPSLALVDETTLNRAEAALGTRFPRVMTVPYLDPAGLRIGDVLRDPDPKKVRSIVLIRTR